MSKSPSLKTKLDRLFTEDQAVTEVTEILGRATSLARFDSKRELREHLCEGALLNINRMASKALSIPCGEYMVWTLDAGHTMLVPTPNKDKEVFESAGKNFELHTPSLLAAYNSVERVLAEDLPPEFEAQQGGGEEAEKRRKAETKAGKFKSKASTIDRTPLLRAMEQRYGKSGEDEDGNEPQEVRHVTKLANAVGVDPPAISRLLRKPKDVQGDPGGRNPSIGLASELARVLRTDVEALFPDIFGGGRKLEPRQTTGSHGGGKGGVSSKRKKARGKWTQGSPPGGASESRKRKGRVFLEDLYYLFSQHHYLGEVGGKYYIAAEDDDGIYLVEVIASGGTIDSAKSCQCRKIGGPYSSVEQAKAEFEGQENDTHVDNLGSRRFPSHDDLELDIQHVGSRPYGQRFGESSSRSDNLIEEGVDPELIAVLLELDDREIDRDPDPSRQTPTPGGGINSALGKVTTGVQNFGVSNYFTNTDVLAHQLGLNRVELAIVMKLKLFERTPQGIAFNQDRFNSIYRQVYKSNPPPFGMPAAGQNPEYPAPPPVPGKKPKRGGPLDRPGMAPASSYAP